MEERWPWEAEGSLEANDPLAHQRHEESIKEQLPRSSSCCRCRGR